MLMLARCTVLATLALLASPASQVQVGEEALKVTAEGGTIVLQFGEDGERLADVLSVFQQLLGVPIDSRPDEVANVNLKVEGPQSVEPGRVRDLLDSLLERHEFWCWDDVSSGGLQIVVRSRTARFSRFKGNSMPGFTPLVVTPDELEAGPQPRLPLYTVVFHLQHVQASNQLVMLQAMLDSTCETVRSTESNALIVTASRAHLLQLRAILAASDQPLTLLPPGGFASVAQRLTHIEERLALLEKHVLR
jgi:hypothetical protein